jgi:membrane-bound ClpP family serine protease
VFTLEKNWCSRLGKIRNFFGLLLYGLSFYGAPYFLLALLTWLLKASNLTIHLGFIGITLVLLFIASLWLLPPDPSGLPIQWMGYWPLSVILCLILMGGGVAFTKYKNS